MKADPAPQGVFAGTDGAEAIGFAIELGSLAGPHEALEFLEGWNEGDTTDWPEFKPVLVKDQKRPVDYLSRALSWLSLVAVVVAIVWGTYH